MSALEQGSSTVKGARSVIGRFTYRRVLRGALILGLFAGLENVLQGFGIAAAYPSLAQRERIVHDLASNPALGVLYGDAHSNIASTAGYMVYRTSALLAVVAGVWGLLTATRMLRGQEEDGRWEVLLTGATTARRATRDTLLGIGLAIGAAYLVAVAIIATAGASNKIGISLTASLFYGLALLISAVLFATIGALTSQLAATRRRAVLYGLLPLVGLYVLRAIGNVARGLAWLKDVTPFGWVDRLHPLVDPRPIWLVPLVLATAFCMVVALYVAGRRDLGESLVADTATARPRYRLLRSPLGVSFRMGRGTLFGWLLGSVAMSAIIAGVAKTAAQSLADSSSLSGAVTKLSGGTTASLATAFLSIGGYFTATILMVMVITGFGAVREEEGRGRLDNFLVGTVSRSRWLAGRLVLLAAAAVAICLLSSLSVWAVAAAQGVSVDEAKLVIGGLNVLGPVILLLGAGTLLYGLRPRWVTPVLYVWLAWSFTADIVASVMKLSKAALNTSLLHQIALTPAAEPKWSTVALLTVSGVVLAAIGAVAFQRRDLVVE